MASNTPDPENINPPDDKEPTLIMPGVGPIPENPADILGGAARRDLPDMAEVLIDHPPEMNSYDTVMTFIRAQGAFIRAQSYFLEQGRNELDDKKYIQHLTGFATAQATLIRAQQDFLRMFGAM